MKKILALLLVLAMFVTMFIGCKKEDEGTGIPVEDYECSKQFTIMLKI